MFEAGGERHSQLHPSEQRTQLNPEQLTEAAQCGAGLAPPEHSELLEQGGHLESELVVRHEEGAQV